MKASQKWFVAVVVIIGPALAIMDDTIVSVILSQMQKAFQTNFETITWTVMAYFLAQAAAMAVVGYVSDRFGSKLVYLASLALFISGSLLCALAPTKEALFAFRVLQGIGGGALIPLAFAIIYRIFPPHQRGLVTGIISIPLLLAPAIGPTVGGYLSTNFDWYSVFLINVPLGIMVLLLSFRILQEQKSEHDEQTPGVGQRFDIPGLLLSVVGVTVLVYGISRAGLTGWGDQIVLISILIGLLTLVGFVIVELRVSDPVLDLRLFTNYTFAISNFLIWMTLGVFVGSLFLLPLFFESVLGETAQTAGVFLIGQFLTLSIGMAISGVLYNRLGPRIPAVFGLLLTVAGLYGLTRVDANTSGASLQVWLLLRGFGLGFINQPLQALAISVVSNKDMARASSLLNVTRQMVTATAVAALTTYLTQQTAIHGVRQQALAAGMADTFWIILILSVLCIPLALVIGRDPAVEAHKQAKQAHVSTEEVGVMSGANIISTLTATGEEAMGPEMLLWRYPANDVVNGSLLTVRPNQFCVLQCCGTSPRVYETGRHIVQPPADPYLSGLQLDFSGESISWQYEILYINRDKMLVKTGGVVTSRKIAEVDYSVDYSIHVATREDAIRLVKHLPSLAHTLTTRELNVYVRPLIEDAVNQLLLTTPLMQVKSKMQDLSQLLYQHLQAFLSTYGITLDSVNVYELHPRGEQAKGLVTLKASGLIKLDAIRLSTAVQQNLTEHRLLKVQYKDQEQDLCMIRRKTLEHYANEIVKLQSELEMTRATVDLRMDLHSAVLQELSHAISTDLRLNAPTIDNPEPKYAEK